jgi:outer membrane protein assembly factor BamB
LFDTLLQDCERLMRHRRATRALASLGLVLGLPFLAFSAKAPEKAGAEPSTEITHAVPSPASTGPRQPATLGLRWTRELPPLSPAWPDQPRMQFDTAARPVPVGNLILVNSTRTDSVAAYDAATGSEVWRFHADGPVRFAPAVWNAHAYVGSDDGFLYCLEAATGRIVWKVRGGPNGRKILGNERLISMWPVRGAPVVAAEKDGKGTVYFAAGIWPFMGIFLHALDAKTGEVVWTNDGDGSMFIKQPHQADAFAGVAPQGELAVVGDNLIVPSGRSVPACYHRRTGKLIHFVLADNSKLGGGTEVVATPQVFFNGGGAFDVRTGAYLGKYADRVVFADGLAHVYTATSFTTYNVRGQPVVRESMGLTGKKSVTATWQPPVVATTPLPVKTDVLIKAGDRLYGAGDGKIFSITVPNPKRAARVVWQANVPGHPVYLAAANGRLFVSTREGGLYCFANGSGPPRAMPLSPSSPTVDEWTAKARTILEDTGVRSGYGVVWGVGTGRLIEELVRQSELRLVVVDPDAQKVALLRDRLHAQGLFSERVSLLAGYPETMLLPPYFASLMTSEDLTGFDVNADFVHLLYQSLRPYGGVACLPLPADGQKNMAGLVQADATMPQAQLKTTDDGLLLTREGPLPGAANWTHEHADAANSRVSKDSVVKAPLGLLWFGGSSNEKVLPRHGHGPQPQVVDGRLIIEGPDMMRASDIYTGRVLWETSLPGVGKVYDVLPHQPGANAGGSNFASCSDGIYVLCGKTCVRLDPATGNRLGEFTLPPLPGEKTAPAWSFLTVCDDYLVGGCNPTADAAKLKVVSSSWRLSVMNRHDGRVLWSTTAASGFRNNGVCIGNGTLFAIDRPSPDHLAYLQRRGETDKAPSRLLALDLATGTARWIATTGVFGTWLSYSAKHDVLVEAGRNARDTLSDEPKGMRVYRAADGTALWHNSTYVGPAMLHGDEILKDTTACELLTGKPILRRDPLTGEMAEWSWTRTYGCNTPSASENLLTFRSGAAGYFDLCNDGGTANLGGFRSSCTNNLIVAGGVLNAPDYTRNCTCSYQNQTSVAFVPMPEADLWTFRGGAKEVKGVVRQAGILLGAPGSRKAENGTLWLEHPSVGTPSPHLAAKTVPANADYFRHNSAQVEGNVPHWVVAAGARGLRSLTVPLAPAGAKDRVYTVRLYFVEPDKLGAGQRLFDVKVQGKTLLRGLDVSREAGGSNRGLVKEFKGVVVGKELVIDLRPMDGSAVKIPVLSAVEVLADGW